MDPKEESRQPDWIMQGTREHILIGTYINTIKMHRSLLERHLNKTGVFRSQHQLLMCIFHNPGISQKELADYHHISTAAVAVSLKKLEKGGYIERLVDAKDNRFNQICLTVRGKEVAKKSVCVFEKIEQRMFGGFSDMEKEIFGGYLKRIQANMETMLQETESEGQKS